MPRKSTTSVNEDEALAAEREANLADAERAGQEMQADIDRSLAGSTPRTFDDAAGSPAPGTGGGEDVERISVETTGPFMLQDPYTLDEVDADGCHSVRKTSFIDTKLSAGVLKECTE